MDKSIVLVVCTLSSVHSSIWNHRFLIRVEVEITVAATRTWEINTTALGSHWIFLNFADEVGGDMLRVMSSRLMNVVDIGSSLNLQMEGTWIC